MDGDITVTVLAPRQRLLAALDEVISEKLNPRTQHQLLLSAICLALAQRKRPDGWLQ
ncbi:hypothetical protein ACLBR5_01530 [Escherichia coli]